MSHCLGADHRADPRSHLPSHRIVSKNVRPSEFTPSRVGKNFHTWRNGGSPSVRLTGETISALSSRLELTELRADVLSRMKLSLFLLALAILYHLLVRFGGGEADLHDCGTKAEPCRSVQLYTATYGRHQLERSAEHWQGVVAPHRGLAMYPVSIDIRFRVGPWSTSHTCQSDEGISTCILDVIHLIMAIKAVATEGVNEANVYAIRKTSGTEDY